LNKKNNVVLVTAMKPLIPVKMTRVKEIQTIKRRHDLKDSNGGGRRDENQLGNKGWIMQT
jgi:hypothetical protein